MEKTEKQMTLFDLDSSFGKMSPELSPRETEKISKRFLKKPLELQTTPYLYLDLREGYGNLLGAFWEENSPLLGEFWMLNTGVSPKDAKESFLSQILEDTPLPKYYLSKTACLGILRRAKSREKELPKQLKTALEIQAGITQADDSSLSSMNYMKSYGINQRDEGIDLENRSGALMETQNIQTQTFVTEPMFCLNDQGGNRMDITENITTTLRASMGGNLPIVMRNQQEGRNISESFCPTITSAAGTRGENQPVLFDNHGKDCRYNGPLKVAPTVAAVYGTGGNNVPLVSKPIAYSLDSKDSNSMKSGNPTSGCRETDKSRTLDTANPDPSKNQGGIAIVQESYCIASNTINRQDHNGGNGHGVQKDISYTLTTSDIHAIYRPDPYQDVVGTLCTGDWKGAGNQYVSQDKCVVNNQSTIYGQSAFADYKEGCGTLRAEGGDNGGGSENLAVSRNLVRRLTPLECERLQGFPDDWTNIPKASDSPRYKALGNSVAIPCVDFVLRGIAFFLQKIKEEQEAR